MRISILGYYGVPNIGDEGILVALLRKVRRELPSASIRVSARSRSYASRMHAVGTYPLEQGNVAFLAEMM